MSHPKAKDYRKIAREKLSGHWGEAVLTTFVAALLGGVAVNSTTFSANVDLDKLSDLADKIDWDQLGASYEHIMETVNVSPALLTFVGIVTAIMSIWSLATFILGGPTRMGLCQYNIDLMKGESKFTNLFVHYDKFGKGFLAKLLVGIFVFLWTLLFIVPGIIMNFAYQMTFYILADNPDMDVMDAIKESKKMMKGHKWQLFCLQFSFIGWAILSAFTIGIGSLFLAPYIEAATAAFYKQISGAEVEIVEAPVVGDVEDVADIAVVE